MKFNIRLLYLYLFAFVGLSVSVIGSVSLVDLALKTYVFQVSEYSYPVTPFLDEKGNVVQSVEEQLAAQQRDGENQRKRTLSNSIAMIAIGMPLYFYHWATIKRENKS